MAAATAGTAGTAGTGGRRPAWSGAELIHPDQGVSAMARIVAAGATQVAVLPVDAARLGALWPTGSPPPLLAEMAAPAGHPPEAIGRMGGAPGRGGRQVGAGGASNAAASIRPARDARGGNAARLLDRVRAARPDERVELVADFLRAEILAVLGADPADPPDLSRGFFDMGMDSLMALELKNSLQAVLGRPIPATLVFEYPTVDELAAVLVTEITSAGTAGETHSGTAVDDLSDQEVDAALESMLGPGGARS
jgi:acyl carrier protein